MNANTVTVRLPDWMMTAAQDLAAERRMTLEQFAVTAVLHKIAAETTAEDFLRRRFGDGALAAVLDD